MGNITENVKDRITKLIDRGELLLLCLVRENSEIKEKNRYESIIKERYRDIKNIPSFSTSYESWYSEALLVIKLIIPVRLDDFVKLYKNDKRKSVDVATYSISDAILGITYMGGKVGPSWMIF